ncbi:hypothetical protein I302_100307 [Kwoniella bestiolae CBS 10118]|uniref:Uncharacterized protein n=1 Tax=Kwoniella bestiolae CBS 10118 TaxID=1296100 RepID=A0A1B9G4R9_9TREE|nr:hypothetical protein I302_03679 [Kwoniella bestiolae CBS 10118]OCF26002.1 hypothetical protein I302_03679 [Kwoniella bestiolae CBS 10118]
MSDSDSQLSPEQAAAIEYSQKSLDRWNELEDFTRSEEFLRFMDLTNQAQEGTLRQEDYAEASALSQSVGERYNRLRKDVSDALGGKSREELEAELKELEAKQKELWESMQSDFEEETNTCLICEVDENDEATQSEYGK